MENAIRVLTIFAGSGELAFIVFVLVTAAVALYIARRIFSNMDRQAEQKTTELEHKVEQLEFKVSRQIEHQK